MNDLNVVHAASLARINDTGEPRRGTTQDDLGLVSDGAVAIRDGVIVAVGTTDEVLAAHGADDVPTIDAHGRCVLPGLVECHSHPLFAGDRHHEYAERLGGASLAEVAARGGGIWSSVVATRAAGDDELLEQARHDAAADPRRRRDDAGGQVGLRADGRRGTARARPAAAGAVVDADATGDHVPRCPRRATRPRRRCGGTGRPLHGPDRQRHAAGRRRARASPSSRTSRSSRATSPRSRPCD